MRYMQNVGSVRMAWSFVICIYNFMIVIFYNTYHGKPRPNTKWIVFICKGQLTWQDCVNSMFWLRMSKNTHSWCKRASYVIFECFRMSRYIPLCSFEIGLELLIFWGRLFGWNHHDISTHIWCHNKTLTIYT